MFNGPLGIDWTIWSPGANRSIWDGPSNGNWGGGSWSAGIGGGKYGNAPLLDSGDACYQRHDNCYDSGVGKQSCDANLVNELKSLPDDSSKWPIAPRPRTEGDSDRFRQGAIRIFE